ncbi:lysophosphatidic acid receptor 6-like [Odontesthes bonariensis]
MVVGLPLNIVALWILHRHHSLKSPSSVFMVNLAISDLLLVITLPMRIYFYATGNWSLGKLVCVSITMLFRNNIRSSSIFITFISVDRLLAVVYPLRSRHLRTSSRAVKGAVLAWLFVLVMNIPEGLNFYKKVTSNETTCFESVPFGHRRPFGYFYLVLVLILMVINIVCTAMVSWTLRSHLSDSARVNNKVNVLLIFFLNLVMFIICFLPVSLGAITVSNSSELTPMICLASVNCCLDPLLYYFSLDAFWKKKETVDTTREQMTTQRTEDTHCHRPL